MIGTIFFNTDTDCLIIRIFQFLKDRIPLKDTDRNRFFNGIFLDALYNLIPGQPLKRAVFVSSVTLRVSSWFKILDTVAAETDAFCAMSLIVAMEIKSFLININLSHYNREKHKSKFSKIKVKI